MCTTETDTKANPSLSGGPRADVPWPWRIEAEFAFAIDETGGDEEALAEWFGVHPRTVRRWAGRHGLAEEVYGATE